MKATIDIPDDLYRHVKAKSALLGRAVRDVTVDLYRRWLAETPVRVPLGSDQQWLDEWVRLGGEALRDAPDAPTVTDIIKDDRDRLGRR